MLARIPSSTSEAGTEILSLREGPRIWCGNLLIIHWISTTTNSCISNNVFILTVCVQASCRIKKGRDHEEQGMISAFENPRLQAETANQKVAVDRETPWIKDLMGRKFVGFVPVEGRQDRGRWTRMRHHPGGKQRWQVHSFSVVVRRLSEYSCRISNGSPRDRSEENVSKSFNRVHTQGY